jgi:thioesterase domain-containing protein
MAAIVALELAQQLPRAGEQVSLLILTDQPGPEIHLSKRDWLY